MGQKTISVPKSGAEKEINNRLGKSLVLPDSQREVDENEECDHGRNEEGIEASKTGPHNTSNAAGN